MPAQSQTYTPKEATAIAQKLKDLKILSPLGEAILLDRIRHTKTAPEFDENHPGLSRNGEWDQEELSNRSLLFFLQEALRREQFYRMGPAEVTKFVTDAEGKQSLQTEKPQRTAGTMAYARGPKLEALIPVEDVLPEKGGGWGFTTYGPPASTKKGEWGWIAPSRSALGKTRSRTVRDLQRIGLIEPAIAEELLLAIKSNTLLWEWSVLEKAAALSSH